MRTADGAINQTAVRVHSVNGTFPDVIASVFEVGAGTPGKIAWRAELFDEPPITFLPRKSNKIDQAIADVIDRHNLTVPIVHLQDKFYLIGPNRCVCDIVSNKLVIHHNDETQNFEDYVPTNEKTMQRMLVFEMIKSDQTLEFVIEALIANREVRGLYGNKRAKSPTLGRMTDLHTKTSAYSPLRPSSFSATP